jgi:hypothetical protein
MKALLVAVVTAFALAIPAAAPAMHPSLTSGGKPARHIVLHGESTPPRVKRPKACYEFRRASLLPRICPGGGGGGFPDVNQCDQVETINTPLQSFFAAGYTNCVESDGYGDFRAIVHMATNGADQVEVEGRYSAELTENGGGLAATADDVNPTTPEVISTPWMSTQTHATYCAMFVDHVKTNTWYTLDKVCATW